MQLQGCIWVPCLLWLMANSLNQQQGYVSTSSLHEII